RNFSFCDFNSSSNVPRSKEKGGGGGEEAQKYENDCESGPKVKKVDDRSESVRGPIEDYPSGEFQFEEFKRFQSDQLNGRISLVISLPQICENIIKAAYDPRISAVYLHIEILSWGWGKVEEIRRHILDFKKSEAVPSANSNRVHKQTKMQQSYLLFAFSLSLKRLGSCVYSVCIKLSILTTNFDLYLLVRKFIVAYAPECREKEYYLASACEEIYAPPSAYFSLLGLTVQASFFRGVLDKVGIEPQVLRIGKYESTGDQRTPRTMSEETCEMLTSLLDNIYGDWLDKVSSAQGKKREDLENFINEGVFQVERLKEEGRITNISYDDEVISMLRERLGVHKDQNLPMVDYRQPTCFLRKYSAVRKWTLGLSGGKNQIAVIRASGSSSRARSPLNVSSSGIIAEQFIEKIRSVRVSKRYKAVIIRIDTLEAMLWLSDLIWREIRLLAASKPVIASMSDVAASGGYYMAMAAGTIVAENLTLTGSIGVVTGKFNLGKLYEKIGFNKEIISRGRFAELLTAEHRPFRSMPVDKMEEVAQGRVWTGKDAASRGLVDATGGLSRAIVIAKMKANIPQDGQVTVVELSRPSPTLPEILSGIGNTLVGVDRTLKELLEELKFSDGVEARMDGILFQRLEEYSHANPIFTLMKDYLSSL
ncbi:hypothetical protein I3842_16G075100, partial [Carya illinoinensis]